MTPDAPRILLVDDEQAVQTLLAYPLRKEGYEVVSATTGQEALDRFRDGKFDLVVLDVMLPQLDGFDVCRELRARSTVPIIMLTARDDEFDKVLGLELGADDYITKPFSIREFRSRVRALLRRASTPPKASREHETIAVGGLAIDLARRTVELDGNQVQLTYVEFEPRGTPAAHRGRVSSRQLLRGALWGSADYRDPRTIDAPARPPREKLGRDPADPELIFTVRGVG